MKVIDLLNKIANREEVPENIKWRDSIWEYRSTQQDYYHEELALFEQMQNIRTREFISDEVEIIEENKKIEKLEMHISSQNYMIENENAPMEEKMKLVRKLIYDNSIEINIVKDKINELIREVNKLKNN